MKSKRIDWITTIIPIVLISILCFVFFIWPNESNVVLEKIRFLLGDTFGSYYLIIGLGFFLFSLYIAFSRYGNIILGSKTEKPRYSFISWGCMMFTCGLAADILFYSFSEWILYATDSHIVELGGIQEWSNVFSIFHWSFIPWSFYLVLAVAFAFMLHVKKVKKQKFSEACRPMLGKYTDTIVGRIIDLIAVIALLAGTATTFSVATPLMANIICELLGIKVDNTVITIIILIITCIVYTYSLLHGIRGINYLAKGCIILFVSILVYVFMVGGSAKYIIETGLSSIGRMVTHFFELSTETDPLRNNSFPQNWTIYYWAYWMVWCVAAPFFIGSISRGRTIKQVIMGGYLFGVGATIVSFVVLGNYSLGLQMKGRVDLISDYLLNGDLYQLIIKIIKSLPGYNFVFILLLVTMIAFYATSFDSIALTASCYSYKELEDGEMPNKVIQFIWCVLLIVLPIALLFSESSMSNLQTVSIVAAFPLGIVMLLIVFSFWKNIKANEE